MYNVSSSGMVVNHGSAHSRFAIVCRRLTADMLYIGGATVMCNNIAQSDQTRRTRKILQSMYIHTYMCRTWPTYGLFVSYLSLRISLLCGKDTFAA